MNLQVNAGMVALLGVSLTLLTVIACGETLGSSAPVERPSPIPTAPTLAPIRRPPPLPPTPSQEERRIQTPTDFGYNTGAATT